MAGWNQRENLLITSIRFKKCNKIATYFILINFRRQQWWRTRIRKRWFFWARHEHCCSDIAVAATDPRHGDIRRRARAGASVITKTHGRRRLAGQRTTARLSISLVINLQLIMPPVSTDIYCLSTAVWKTWDTDMINKYLNASLFICLINLSSSLVPESRNFFESKSQRRNNFIRISNIIKYNHCMNNAKSIY